MDEYETNYTEQRDTLIQQALSQILNLNSP